MTLYNKTTVVKRYGSKPLMLTLPASLEEGVRGEGVVIDPMKKAAMTKDWKKLKEDYESGSVEIEND